MLHRKCNVPFFRDNRLVDLSHQFASYETPYEFAHAILLWIYLFGKDIAITVYTRV